MRVAAIIPALNEEAAIGDVVAAVPRSIVDKVIVVDNGSTDGTAQAAAAAGAVVVYEPRRGYGRACMAGVAAAGGAEALLFLDGDGSCDPAEAPLLVAPLLAGQADLVLGSRELGGVAHGAMAPHQRLGNRLVAWLLRRLYGIAVTDIGPFRAVRSQALCSLAMREQTYGWPVEMVVKAARQGLRIIEVPTRSRPRAGGESKVSGTLRGTLLAGYHMLALTLRYAIKRS